MGMSPGFQMFTDNREVVRDRKDCQGTEYYQNATRTTLYYRENISVSHNGNTFKSFKGLT